MPKCEISAFPQTLPISVADLVAMPSTAVRDAALFDAMHAGHATRTSKISAILTAGFQDDKGNTPDFDKMSMLERQIALLTIAISLGRWPAMFVCTCTQCNEWVDLQVDKNELSLLQSIEPTQPTFKVYRNSECLEFMMPNGSHEAQMEESTELDMQSLVEACVINGPLNNSESWIAPFSDTLDALVGQAVNDLPFECPECHQTSSFWFDPLDWINRHSGESLLDVHQLASAYGWAEDKILAMTSIRRKFYLNMLAAS
jgi:hypothetical protein